MTTKRSPMLHARAAAVAAGIAACAGITACGGGGGSSAAPAPPAPTADVELAASGAVCDGRFDNSAVLSAAIAAAKSRNAAVSVPAGVCAHGDVVRLDGVKLKGQGSASVLHALNPERSAILMSGDGAEVRDLKLTVVAAASRQAVFEATGIATLGARNFVIDRVDIEGTAAAGIQVSQASSGGRITNNRIRDTLADAINVTERSTDILLEANRIENSGDDGIAVVSYLADGGLTQRITARSNVVLNNRGGRQMSVVGGASILFENNRLENSGAFACLYIAQENSFNTYGARDVLAQRNTLKNCGSDATGHSAILLVNDGSDANANISIVRNDIVQSGQAGVRILGTLNTNILVDSNRIEGANPALDIQTPGVTVIPFLTGVVGALP